MEVIENILIEFLDQNHNVSSIERILWISPDKTQVVTFNVIGNSSLPEWKSYTFIEEKLKDTAKILEKDPYQKKLFFKEPSDYSKNSRDKAWNLIETMVRDEPDIFDETLRGKIIAEYIEKYPFVHKTQIYRKLRQYWRGGKTKDALLGNFQNCGGPGKERTSKTGIKRGRKPAITKLEPNLEYGINISDEDRQIFRIAIKLHYHTRKKNPLRFAYDQMLFQFYHIGYELKNGEMQPVLPRRETLPSFEQFKYYYYKERKIKEALITREGERNFNLRKRPAIGNATNRASGPGAVYEIDATIGDFHLVHSINRRNIGRPILYYIKDVFSRLIAGFSVGLDNVSWRTGMIGMENATTDKVAFCAQYGIEITEEEWPSRFLPKSITADRGEFESDFVEDLIENLGVRVDNTPPYRGDFKPFVEQQFRIMNTKAKPIIPGAIRKDVPERGERDYRLDAALSIQSFTKVIILLIQEYNHSILEDYPLDKDMAKAGLLPTPINLWNWGMKNRYVGLHSKPRDVIRLNLMPNAKATVTHDKGIYFGKWKMGYSCDKALSEGWYEKARNSGVWKIPISYDPRNINHIYIPSDNGLEFIKCDLLPQYAQHFGDLCEEEVEIQHIVERANVQRNQTDQQDLKVRTHNKVNKIIKEELKITDQFRDPTLSKAEIIRQTGANREDEKVRIRILWELGESETEMKKESNKVLYFESNLQNDVNKPDNKDESEVYNILKKQINRRKNSE